MSSPISVIVGLGNPGERYQATRHNAGFWLLDVLADRQNARFRTEARFSGQLVKIALAGQSCYLLKPDTFMNHSGRAVSALCHYYRIPVESLLVVHDEIDLDPGTARLKFGGGHGGHNGLRDIISALGSRQFGRLRLGVGHPGNRDQVVDYVLHQPAKQERALIEQAIDEALRVLPMAVAGERERAMHQLHSAC